MSGPVGRRGRWHEFLSGFTLDVKYVPGPTNIVADSMSRWAYGAVDDPGDLTFDGGMEDMLQVQKWDDEDRKLDFAAAADLLTSPIKFIDVLTETVTCARISTSPSSALMNVQFGMDWIYDGDPDYCKVAISIMAGNEEKDFWIFQGRLRHLHLTCVPKKLVTPLLKAIHGAQHAGPDKTVQIFERQCVCAMGGKEFKDLVVDLCRRCQLCQGLKAKKKNQGGLWSFTLYHHKYFTAWLWILLICQV